MRVRLSTRFISMVYDQSYTAIDCTRLYSIHPRVISRNLKLVGGRFREMFGACKHARSSNLHKKNINKYFKKQKSWEVLFINWGVLTPPPPPAPRGCQNITDTLRCARTSYTVLSRRASISDESNNAPPSSVILHFSVGAVLDMITNR